MIVSRRLAAEGMFAPCYSLILTPEELKKKYPKYIQVMEELRAKDHPRGILREVWRRWPRSPLREDFATEFKIPLNSPLQALTTRRDLHEIVINYAKGPNAFTFQVKSREFNDLEEQMQVFYEDQESEYSNAKFVMATGLFEGSFYAVFSHRLRKWVRCICNMDVGVIRKDSLAAVTLVDYACTENVAGFRVRPLIKGFTRLPAQGYSASLFDCYPHRGALNPSLCQEFRRRVRGKCFYAHVIAYKSAVLDSSSDSAVRFPHVIIYLVTMERKLLTVDYDESNMARSLTEVDDDQSFID